MTQLTLKINGAKEIQTGLQRLGRALPQILDADIRLAMNFARRIVSGDYPNGAAYGYTVPLRTGQTYVRTGRYGRGWQVSKNGARSYTLGNRVPYAQYVAGDSRGSGQAWMHVGRWPVLADEVDELARELVDNVDSHIEDSAEAFGL